MLAAIVVPCRLQRKRSYCLLRQLLKTECKMLVLLVIPPPLQMLLRARAQPASSRLSLSPLVRQSLRWSTYTELAGHEKHASSVREAIYCQFSDSNDHLGLSRALFEVCTTGASLERIIGKLAWALAERIRKNHSDRMTRRIVLHESGKLLGLFVILVSGTI